MVFGLPDLMPSNLRLDLIAVDLMPEMGLYTAMKNNRKLQSRLHKFTPFQSMKALDKFLNWINYKGVAERLITHRKDNSKPNDSSGDAMYRPIHNNRLLDWKDQFLMTMTYIYSGKWSNSSKCIVAVVILLPRHVIIFIWIWLFRHGATGSVCTLRLC